MSRVVSQQGHRMFWKVRLSGTEVWPVDWPLKAPPEPVTLSEATLGTQNGTQAYFPRSTRWSLPTGDSHHQRQAEVRGDREATAATTTSPQATALGS